MKKPAEPQEFYSRLRNENEDRVAKLSQTMSRLTLIRLVSFILIFVLFFTLRSSHLALAIVSAILFLIIFLFCIGWYQRTKKSRDYHQAIVDICNLEQGAIKHDFSKFSNGEDFIDYKHRYSYDLDVFGTKSLFQYLNRTCLHLGSIKLAAKLKDIETDKERIKRLQESIKELSHKNEFCINFRANGSLISEVQEEYEKLNRWLEAPSPLKNRKIFKALSFVLPAITIGSALGAAFITAFQGFAVLFFLLNLFLVSLSLKKINTYNASLSPVIKLLTKYHKLLSIIEKEDWGSKYNKKIHDELLTRRHYASASIAQLNKYVNGFDQRMNVFVAIFLEGFLLWDFHFIEKIEHWKEVYGQHFTDWMDALAEYDALISLATCAYNNNDFIYPELSADSVFTARNLGHPLIPGTDRVANDFSLAKKGDFAIVTGANMSGKSTFLRTVAINQILAATGMPVCATEFTCSPMSLYTSMRTSDSLAKNESYFYAELVRLKELLELLQTDNNVFIILDEILKGTNSHDKQKGSKMVLEKIIEMHGTGIIATHDLELTRIEDDYPEKISNHCFEIDIDEAEISFDYKLHQGVTQKMNAILLMKQMGII